MSPEWHTLECFKARSYPVPVESVAKDHPVYVDGTKLVDGLVMIEDKKTDASRIEEFQKLGFSKDTIRMYTDGKFNMYYECSKGKKCNYGSSLPYKPSYAKIGALTELYCDDVKHVIEIKNNEVFFNGALLVSAPEKHNTGKKFTGAQRAQYCKAVIFSIIPGEIKRNVKNRHGNMEYMAVPDDDYLRELIGKYPALLEVQSPEIQQIMRDEHPEKYETQKEAQEIPAIIPDDLVLPEALNAYTQEALTGYPEIDIIEPITDEYDTLLINGMFNFNDSMISQLADDDLYTEEISEMYSLINPVIVQKWTHPHLHCNIIECV